MPDTRCEICADTGFDYLGRPCRRGPHNNSTDTPNEWTEVMHLVRMLVSTIKVETSRHAEFRTETAQRAIDQAEAWLGSHG